ncbi:hypothetical protein Sste5346_002949 [Sporothrix stenoceras]|uniref:Uncharacterized protein n=1 Tax=Sporothrix stenoceras TaxID=5173 RepID=A0ABR3ZH62_9PEZI
MAPLGNAALALAINNHLSPPVTTLPSTFSSAIITTRDDASDAEAAKARKKKKEMIRNVLIITINPFTLFLVIWIVFYLVRGVKRYMRYLRQKKKAELEELAVELEWRRQWEAQLGPGSNNYRPPPEKPADGDEKQTAVAATAAVDGNATARKGFSLRWPWSRQKPATAYKPGVITPGTMPPAATTTAPVLEQPETYERASNDTDRTLEVDSAPDRLTDDIEDEKKGMGS